MANESSSSASGGISVAGLLGCIFVTLKLCEVIDWSWWWVTAPFWGGMAILVSVFAVLGVVAFAVILYEKATGK